MVESAEVKRSIAIILCAAVAAASAFFRAEGASFPENEMRMLRTIIENNRLDREGAYMLMAIRKIENGRPGLEFGVGGPRKDHPARRYSDGVRSYYVQGNWAAGTVRKRYTGDIDAFAARYCPLHAARWAKNAKSIIRSLRADPGVKAMLDAIEAGRAARRARRRAPAR